MTKRRRHFANGQRGRSRQSLLLWRPSGSLHSSKMSFPDMIWNESEIYTNHANKTPDWNVQNEINVQSIPARRSVWLWRWWQWRLITQFYKTYSHFPSKKPSKAIVSFMKVCKRTPLSKIPLTFHRRVGRGNGERGVERKRREGGREGGEIIKSIWNYVKYLWGWIQKKWIIEKREILVSFQTKFKKANNIIFKERSQL